MKTELKRKMGIRKTVSVLLVLSALSLGLCGCSKYNSHYNAVGYAHSNGSMSFSSFDGVQVHSFDWDKDTTGHIRYTAKLEKGSATVYYDMDGTKKEWFTVKAGETVEGTGLELPKGNIDILVETNEPCEEGRFTFEAVD